LKYANFAQLMFHNSISVDFIRDIFGVTARTVSYWKRHGPPVYVLERLSLLTGDHDDWKGFRIREGYIVCPNGDKVLSAQIEMYHWTDRQLHIESSKCAQLEKRIAEIKRMGEPANSTRDSDLISLARA